MASLINQASASGTGSVTLLAPVTNSTQTLTLPDATGTLLATVGGGAITSGTAQNTTSGTSIDFTGIPSWVKRITVMFNGVSTNGTSNILIQLGAGSVEATGYAGSGSLIGGASASSANFTTGFGLNGAVASYDYSGNVIILLQNLATNNWVASGVFSSSTLTASWFTSGSKTLSGSLQRVRLTTVGGTDTFDAGSVNILYEG